MVESLPLSYSVQPQKVRNNANTHFEYITMWKSQIMGLAGTTLGAIVQSIATLTGGLLVGFVYGWKLSLVGLCVCGDTICTPFADPGMLRHCSPSPHHRLHSPRKQFSILSSPDIKPFSAEGRGHEGSIEQECARRERSDCVRRGECHPNCRFFEAREWVLPRVLG
jgi:hypothetical protein